MFTIQYDQKNLNFIFIIKNFFCKWALFWRNVFLCLYAGLERGIMKSGKKRGRFARHGIVGEMEDGEEGDAQRQSE